MRRVYYAYTMRLAKHPVTAHAVILLASVFVFARLVHVAAVFNNVSGVELGQLGSYILTTVMSADVATLAVIGIVCFTLLSLRIQLRVPQWYRRQQIA